MSQVPWDGYREVAPKGSIDLLMRLAERVRHRRFLHVNASRYGPGSPVTLARLIPMLGDLGVDVAWDVIVGDPKFYAGVEMLERVLDGESGLVTEELFRSYAETAAENAPKLALEADLVVVHELAPLLLIRYRPSRGRWLWRCHTDLSRAPRRTWHLLRRDVERYDAVAFSLPKFAQRLPVPSLILQPSVDPLSEANRDLHRSEVQQVLERHRVPRDKPILLQVAPYARAKDPLGVVQAYRLAKKYVDCRLVLAGGGASDNPEGAALLSEIREAAARDPDLHPLVLPPDAGLEINALQRASALVIHKPIREEFGLAVAEAMWKGKPVIGSAAGGIPAQVIPEVTGFIVHSIEGAAFRIRQLLQNPDLMARLGGAGREHVRRNFLVTRQLGDYLALLATMT
ncbi:MAG TPA: glycosyltransferase [Candidatus Sulfotelmatobacter sp.]|nr:glycosyltransferase [Candidatus Sulfotelmatobacter sp.]